MDKDIKTHIVLVTGIIQKGDRFLMAKRAANDTQAAGDWAFPGGKVDLDIGSNVIQKTLKKEIKEEVGIETDNNIIFLGNDAFIRSSGHHVVNMFFLCQYSSGTARPLEDQEKIRWFTLKELINSKEIPSYQKHRVASLKNYISSSLLPHDIP